MMSKEKILFKCTVANSVKDYVKDICESDSYFYYRKYRSLS